MLYNPLQNEAINKKRSALLLMTAIVLVAANLRAPITSISPMLELIRHDIPLSNTMSGFLTTLPLLAFAFVSPFVPKLAAKYGMERIIFIALVTLVIGSLLRFIVGPSFLLFGTLLIGIAIAVGNVLLTALIKKNFPYRLGIMTGIYSISMNIFAALGSAISYPIASNSSMSWKATMLVWTSVAFLTVFVWLFQLNYNEKAGKLKENETGIKKSIWKSTLAWKVTIYMGTQSFVFYVLVAWLPDMLQNEGLTITESGLMLSLLQLGGLPFTFIIPIIANRLKNQYWIVFFMALFLFLGFAGLWGSNGNLILTSISVLLIGVGNGTGFSLALMFFNLRTKNTQEAADLSGMAQSFGYLLAACGPFLLGMLHDKSGSWEFPLMVLVIVGLIQTIAGFLSSGNTYVYEEKDSLHSMSR